MALVDTELAAYLSSRVRLVDEALDAVLPPADCPPRILHRAMRHAVLAGGKRLRPLLVLASAEACGLAPEAVLPVACAVECIHTYSLIHDDLPAMDDADTRRGRPTVHVAFGEAIAILAGDALHALAFALIPQAAATCGAERVLAVVGEIAAAIGTDGMVGGQVLDLLGEGRRFPGGPPDALGALPELVVQIHRRKTGALIRACARAGGLLAGADPATLDALTVYGEKVGLAFQIIDDILDLTGDPEQLGKRTRRDVGKATYPAAYGVAESRAAAARLTQEAVDAAGRLGPSGRILAALARDLLERDH
ncbi:MAG: polyprenyl synthetase family protein [Armatimonadota bacterium]|nr:polyprenyl synthetase family protein [Armatimonadota bacterium]MDR7559819.1 polyprenyl synthetase family protein [Armatimonadota bacterium]MDR7587389.1 polyprenyl synthetase family protein [Armatimonadota bacterium]MDR7611027.1 polyprenyl synthetase family protein [Armatimonadota bacterium]